MPGESHVTSRPAWHHKILGVCVLLAFKPPCSCRTSLEAISGLIEDPCQAHLFPDATLHRLPPGRHRSTRYSVVIQRIRSTGFGRWPCCTRRGAGIAYFHGVIAAWVVRGVSLAVRQQGHSASRRRETSFLSLSTRRNQVALLYLLFVTNQVSVKRYLHRWYWS